MSKKSPTRESRWTSAVFALALFVCGTTDAQAKLPDLFGDAPLVEAVQSGSAEKVNAAILDGASVHTRAIDGTPVIVLAASQRKLDLVKLLIENGARPDDKSKIDQTTALTLAASNGDLEIVVYLLDHKADIDQTGALRETALIKAVRSMRIDVTKLLVERGANVEETDSTGATPLDIAQRNGSSELVGILKKATSK